MNLITNTAALHIQSFLKSLGYEAYFVGGCVRDALLQRPIKDYDLTTSAPAEVLLQQAKQAGFVCIPTGLQHGTITFVYQHQHIEVTTYRTEALYDKHRFPQEVRFVSSLQEDLKRRDFTINALAYDQGGVIDCFHGMDDLHHKIIRCIDEPSKRFQEDALRMLRALRFSFVLSFTIEPTTKKAIQANAPFLKHISKERIRDEFNQMLQAPSYNLLLILRDYQVLPFMIPELVQTYNVTQESPYHQFDVFHHTNACLNAALDADLTMKLAIILHDIEKKKFKTIDDQGIAHFKGHAHSASFVAKQILRKLAYDNKTIKEVSIMIEYHDYYLLPNKKQIRKFLYKLHGDFDLARRILWLQHYDNCGKKANITIEKNNNISLVLAIVDEMQQQKEAFHIKDLAIDGNDLLKLGYDPHTIGSTLNDLLKDILQQQEKNNKDYLLKIAERRKQNETTHCK